MSVGLFQEGEEGTCPRKSYHSVPTKVMSDQAFYCIHDDEIAHIVSNYIFKTYSPRHVLKMLRNTLL